MTVTVTEGSAVLPGNISELMLTSLRPQPDLQLSPSRKNISQACDHRDSQKKVAARTSLLTEAASFCFGRRHVNAPLPRFLSNLISNFLLAANKGETNPSK